MKQRLSYPDRNLLGPQLSTSIIERPHSGLVSELFGGLKVAGTNGVIQCYLSRSDHGDVMFTSHLQSFKNITGVEIFGMVGGNE